MIIILPDFGYYGSDYVKGRCTLRYSQLDVINGYTPSLFDELDSEAVPHERIITDKKPSLTEKERMSAGGGAKTVIIPSCGWFSGRKQQSNMSRIICSDHEVLAYASIIAEALYDWGHRYIYNHRMASPVIDKELAPYRAIKIEPFALNGPDTEIYLTKLKELGESIGVGISLCHRARGRMKYGL